MDVTRTHKRGNHETCEYLRCAERRKIEMAHSETMEARAVLFAIDKRGADAEKILGDCYPRYLEVAAREFPGWLPQRPDKVDLIKANMMVRQAQMGVPVLFDLPEPVDTEADDFDVDEFFDSIYRPAAGD